MIGSAALLSSTLLVTVSSVPAAGPAGADTPQFSYTCSGTSLPATAFPTTIIGTIPQGLAAGTHFTVSNFKYLVTIPANVTAQLNTFPHTMPITLSSALSTTIDPIGAATANNAVTVTFPPTTVPASGAFTYTGTATSPTFTASGGSVSLSGGVSSSAYSIKLNTTPEPGLTCTTPSPPPVIAYSEQNSGRNAYVANASANTVSVIDTSINQVAGSPIGVGGSPDYVAITPDGTKAFVTNNSVSANSVSEISTATNTVIKTITVAGARGIAITPDGSTAWVVSQPANALVPINVATGTAGTGVSDAGSGGGATVAISTDGTRAYVIDQFADTVTVIDLVHRTVVDVIVTGLSFPPEVEVSPTGGTGYFDGTNELTPFSTSTDTVGSPIPVCADADRFAISADGSTAWLGCSGQGVVQKVDLVSGSVIATRSLGLGASDHIGGVSISPDGTTAYVVDMTAGKVVPFVTATAVARTPITVGASPDGMAIMPDQGPTAALTTTYAGTGLSVTFDASSSVPGTTPITSYAWNFGDGSGTQVTTTPSVSHTYSAYTTYTASVTETDAAGTSTTLVSDGQTALHNGSSAATASAPVVLQTTPCVGTICTASVATPATATSPAQTVVVHATTAMTGSLSVSATPASPAVLTCRTHGFQPVTTVNSYSPVGFIPTAPVRVVDLLRGVKSTANFHVCFKSHSAATASYLKLCSVSAPPCISSFLLVPLGLRVVIIVPPGDPKWRVISGASTIELPTNIPSPVVIGTHVAITGTGLVGANNVYIALTNKYPQIGFTMTTGSKIYAPWPYVSKSATKIVFTVPKGAVTGPVVMIWPDKTDETIGSVTVKP